MPYDPYSAGNVFRQQQPIQPKKSNKTIIIAVALVAVAVLIIILFLVFREKQPDKLMDLRIIEINNEVEKGTNLVFEVEALNLGKKEIYDVKLRYDILNKDGGYFPHLRKEETVALKDKSVFPNSIKVNLPVDRYDLRVQAFYESERAEASRSFHVIESTSQPDNSTPDLTPIPQPNQTQPSQPSDNYDSYSENIQHVAGSDNDLEEQALAKCSKTNEAINLCSSISSEANADYCLNECAEKVKNPSFCDIIKDVDRKDDCYMTLALDNKPLLCNQIVNGYKKNTCLALV